MSEKQETQDFIEAIPALVNYDGWVSFRSPYLTMGDFYDYLETSWSYLEKDYVSELATYRAVLPFVVDSHGLGDLHTDDPPFAVVDFVVEAFSELFVYGSLPYFETILAAYKRLSKREAVAAQHKFNTDDYLEEFPALAKFTGTVSFNEVLHANAYSSMCKAIKPVGDKARDMFVWRLYRAALPLSASINLNGVSNDDLTADGENVPLVVGSWLAHVADIYLGGQLNSGKLAKLVIRQR